MENPKWVIHCCKNNMNKKSILLCRYVQNDCWMKLRSTISLMLHKYVNYYKYLYFLSYVKCVLIYRKNIYLTFNKIRSKISTFIFITGTVMSMLSTKNRTAIISDFMIHLLILLLDVALYVSYVAYLHLLLEILNK